MFVSKLRSSAVGLALAASLAAASCGSCRGPAVPEATYREAVTAFHTALAALETSQEPLARQKLDRVIALVPQEPAGWANLGLLLLRQQENGPARERLTKAAELAPQNAAIERLLAIAESRAGNSAESIAALAARPRARAGGRQGGLRPGAGDRAAGHAGERRRGAARARDAARHQRQPAGAPRRDSPRRQARRRRRGEQGRRRAGAAGAVVAGPGAGPAGRAAPGGRRQPARRRDPRPVPEERARA